MITIYPARKIITMNVRRPEASHVAVRDGWILGAGNLEELAGWGPHEVDDRFADKVIMPGLVEGHCHSREGSGWDEAYVGFYDRTDPDRVVHPGLKSIDEVVGRLQEAERALSDPGEPLLAWGLDPLFFEGRRMVASDLDRVSTARPILVLHQSGHIINANGELMRRAGITRDTNVMGVLKDASGEPSGELQGPALRSMLYRAAGRDRGLAFGDPKGLWRFACSAQLAGVTTATDLANDLPEETVAGQVAATSDDGYPLRIVPAFIGMARPAPEGVAWVKSLIPRGNERLRYGLVKLVFDGSIQGFTARLKSPGYYNGAENGLWYIDPDELPNILGTYHRAGLQVHIHTNGDQATEAAIDAIERVLRAAPDPDARFTLQHCQMAHDAHFRRMARLGDLREPLRQPPLLLGRPALRADDGPGAGRAHGRGGQRAAARRRVLHPFRRSGHPPRSPVHGLVRGEPPDLDGTGARHGGAGDAWRTRSTRSPSAPRSPSSWIRRSAPSSAASGRTSRSSRTIRWPWTRRSFTRCRCGAPSSAGASSPIPISARAERGRVPAGERRAQRMSTRGRGPREPGSADGGQRAARTNRGSA